MADFTIKRGDRKSYIRRTLYGDDGVAMNLTGATVKFIMRNVATGMVTVNAGATIINAAGGIVEYQWISGDTNTVGDYEGEFEVTIGGLPQTFPNDRFIAVTIVGDVA